MIVGGGGEIWVFRGVVWLFGVKNRVKMVIYVTGEMGWGSFVMLG